MNVAKTGFTALGVALAMGVAQFAWAAQEDDSVYEWGRWAVLSPAAGGEPFVGALLPGALNNARPEEAIEFHPEVIGSGTDDPRDRPPPPPVVDDPRDRPPPPPPGAS